MAKSYLLEISVQTADAAQAAERGGAHRIELCAELSVGGLTPSDELMRQAREHVRLPIFAMVRPRTGNFVYSAEEFERMRRDILLAKRLGMGGVVLGLLTHDGRVDVPRTKELIENARPLPVTFHRAFDACANLFTSLEEVIEAGAARILTSGGAASAPDGIADLAKLVTAAGDRIIILPGSGIHAGNIAQVARETRAREFHSGLGSVLRYGQKQHGEFEEKVRRLRREIDNLT